MWLKDKLERHLIRKKHRTALLALFVLAIALQAALYWELWLPQTVRNSPEALARFDSLVNWQEEYNRSVRFSPVSPFDPNTASDSLLRSMGLPPYLVQRVLKYRKGGGVFRQKADLLKIYAMDSVWYAHVEGFINLPERMPHPAKAEKNWKEKKRVYKPFDPNYITLNEAESHGLAQWQVKRMMAFREKVRPFAQPEDLYQLYGFDSSDVEELLPYVKITQTAEPEVDALVQIDINTADSAALLSVRGIGPFSAGRIVQYRERLGGFVQLEQLLEVYGMQAERFEQIRPQLLVGAPNLRKINLNSCSFKELLAHPYLNYEQVKMIFRFRNAGRAYERIEEIEQIELIDARLFAKIAPYLEV